MTICVGADPRHFALTRRTRKPHYSYATRVFAGRSRTGWWYTDPRGFGTWACGGPGNP